MQKHEALCHRKHFEYLFESLAKCFQGFGFGPAYGVYGGGAAASNGNVTEDTKVRAHCTMVRL